MAYCITAHSPTGMFLLSAAAAMAAEDLRQNQNKHFARDSEDLVRLARAVFRAHSGGTTSYVFRMNGQICPTLLACIQDVLKDNTAYEQLTAKGPTRGAIVPPITAQFSSEKAR